MTRPGSPGPAAHPAARDSAHEQDPADPGPTRRRVALSFAVRPDAVEEAVRVLADYPSPRTTVDERTRLLGTTVFLDGARVVRIADVAGDVGVALRHLSSQPAVREVERRLDPLLAEPRDLSHPAGARAFFARAMMRSSLSSDGGARLAGPLPPHRWAVRLPVPPGAGSRAVELLAAVRPETVVADTVHRDDTVVWLLEGDQQPDRLLHVACAEDSVRDGWAPLRELLAPALDGPTRSLDLPELLAGRAMRRVTDRRAA